MLDTDGASLGFVSGCDEGWDEGLPDKLGLSLGCEVGQCEDEGCSLG